MWAQERQIGGQKNQEGEDTFLLRVGQPTGKGNFQKKVLAHLPIHKKPLLLRSETVPPVSRQEAKREERENRSQYPLL